MSVSLDVGQPKAITTSTAIASRGGLLLGIFVSTANATSKVAFCDATASVASAGAGRFVAPFTISASAGKNFYRVPASFGTGLYVSMSGSAASLTVIWSPAA